MLGELAMGTKEKMIWCEAEGDCGSVLLTVYKASKKAELSHAENAILDGMYDPLQ